MTDNEARLLTQVADVIEEADIYSLNRQKFAYTIMGDVLSASEMDERKWTTK